MRGETSAPSPHFEFMNGQPVTWPDFSRTVTFKNCGAVTRGMRFSRVEHEILYLETDESWSTTESPKYLHAIQEGEPVAPPLGMRSSVPLGGLGAGTVELRADGRFMDWNLFNTMPFNAGETSEPDEAFLRNGVVEEVFSTTRKTQFDGAFMALRVQGGADRPVALALRTAPLEDLPAIEQITYSGSYPVSRLAFQDNRLPLSATLYAYSEFRMRDAERSAAPCVLFSLELHNSTPAPMTASFMFNMPNVIKGHFATDKGRLTLINTRPGLRRGSMTFAADGADRVSYGTGASIADIWEGFAADGTVARLDPLAANGAISAMATVAPGETKTITLAMAWYFPDRRSEQADFPVKGNYYTRLFAGSDEVADTVLSRLPETWRDILELQRACFDNSLPEWLQDALLNSVATMFKTGLWGEDGRYLQWESFSCPNLEPIHITLSRSLPLMFFFPDLEKAIIRSYGPMQQPDGYVTEKIWSRLPGKGRVLGDCSPVFILAVHMIHQWTGDDAFLDEMWPHVKRAAEWQIGRSQEYGLPAHLDCTYDLSGFARKGLLGYNGVMHVAGLASAISMGKAKGDEVFVAACEQALGRGRKALNSLLWNGSAYPAYWDAHEAPSTVIHADILYGQLWAYVLGLGKILPADNLASHLASEATHSDTPYGLRIMVDTARGVDPDRRERDDTVWQIASITWSGLQLFLGHTDVDDALEQGRKLVNHWRLTLKDPWDYKDLTAAWDGKPYCNSHYGRQLMFWSLPLGLAGQNYSAVDKRLSFDPKPKAPYRLPFYTPSANGVLAAAIDGAVTLHVYSGTLDLSEVVISGKVVARDLLLKQGDAAPLLTPKTPR